MSDLLGVDGIRSRMAELAAIVDPESAAASASSSSTSSTDFAALLAAAEGSSSLTGSDSTSLTSTLSSLLASATSGTSGTSGTDISSGTATAQDLISDAEKYLGTPYKWGGESLSEGGLDCSGLVLRSLTDLGVTGIPRTAKEQSSLGSPVSSLAQAQPGDLLVFNGGTHIAIYLGDNRMIEAPKPGGVVRETAVWATPTAIRRILPQSATTSTATAAAATSSATTQRALLALLAGASS
jgi:cell wall-associated NlpC family hydrolase